MLKVLDETPNPALGVLVRDLRDAERQKDRGRFRGSMRLLGTLLAHEIAKTLPTASERVRTPLGARDVLVPAERPVLATALRAGIPFLEGYLELHRDSDVMFFGAARVEGSRVPGDEVAVVIERNYEAIVDCRDRTLIFVDPMVATASTVIGIHADLVARDLVPRRFIVAGLIGWRGAHARITAAIPGAELWLVTCDDDLDDRSYIVPGLGDAGDLCYGPKI